MNPKQTLIAAAIMLITSTCIIFLNKSNDLPIKKSLSHFPVKIGDWQGTTSRFSEKVYEILGVDDSVLINYYNDDHDEIQLYIGYYQSQRQGDIIHSPKHCMPGSGWDIIETSLIPLSLKNQNGETIRVIKLILKKDFQLQAALYWFNSRGRVINSEYTQKMYLVWDSIIKHRTDGSLVRLLSPITDQNEKKTIKRLKQFAEQIIPILNEFIPS